MKKGILLLMIFSVMIKIFITPAHSAKGTIGLTTWYVKWENEQIDKVDPFFMYGPALSINLNEQFSLSSITLFGTTNANKKTSSESIDYDIKRIDSDTAINYKLNQYFRFFLGYKIMWYTIDFQFNGTDVNQKFLSIGPGLGGTLTYPLGKNYFLLGSASGMYVFGKAKTDIGATEQKETNTDFYGFNTTISIAHYFTSTRTVLALGGRYQPLKNEKSSNWDQFYGITLSAMYSFEL